MKKYLFSALAALLFPFCEVVSATSFEAVFAENDINIESTSPLDDLLEDEVFKSEYSHGLYNVGVNTGYAVIDIAEYKYGTSGYALYIYLWNCEQDSRFLYDSPRNRVSMLNQKNEEYVHLNVEFVTKTATQFYKYKVEFNPSTVSFLNGDERIYTVVGFEAIEEGDENATDYKVGKSLKYTGFYYNETLECEACDIETLSLEVHGGVYRTASSSASQTARNDLFYVWFGVEKSVFERYGNVYAVHCDYYQFDLSGKIVALLSEYLDEWENYYGHVGTSYMYDGINPDYGFSLDTPIIEINNLNTKITGSYLESLFDIYDLCDLANVNFNDIKLNVEAGFYKNLEVYFCDSYDLLSYGDTHNGWDNFWARLKGVNTSENSLEGISAIERFSDVSSINSCSCIDSEDKNSMNLYSVTHATQDIVCLRFANSVYDSSVLVYEDYVPSGGPGGGVIYHDIGFVATRGLYAIMDFDIIDVTFMDDYGNKTVLPVVASPINIFNDFENTDVLIDWAKILMLALQIIALFIGVLLCLKLLSKTLKFDTFGSSNGGSKRKKTKKKYRRK